MGGGSSIKLKIQCFDLPLILCACIFWKTNKHILEQFSKVRIICWCFMKANDFLLKLACVLLSHLSHGLFVFHCPENRFQPSQPPAQQWWRRNLFQAQGLIWYYTNPGMVARTQDGKNVWILQKLSHGLFVFNCTENRFQPFTATSATVVKAILCTFNSFYLTYNHWLNIRRGEMTVLALQTVKAW